MRSSALPATREVALALMSSVLAAGVARAEVLMTAEQTPGGVLLSGAGTLNINALAPSISTFADAPFINPGFVHSVARVGAAGKSPIDSYIGLTGAGPFGTGFAATGTSGSGDVFGPSAVETSNGTYIPQLVVPDRYVSGRPLSGTGLFAGETFASLGLTPGVYTWRWGTGVNADRLTLSVVVPEPLGASALIAGSALLLKRRLNRRR